MNLCINSGSGHEQLATENREQRVTLEQSASDHSPSLQQFTAQGLSKPKKFAYFAVVMVGKICSDDSFVPAGFVSPQMLCQTSCISS